MLFTLINNKSFMYCRIKWNTITYGTDHLFIMITWNGERDLTLLIFMNPTIRLLLRHPQVHLGQWWLLCRFSSQGFGEGWGKSCGRANLYWFYKLYMKMEVCIHFSRSFSLLMLMVCFFPTSIFFFFLSWTLLFMHWAMLVE